MCSLYVPGDNMNSCKVMQAQAKSTNSTWSTSRGGGAGRVRFQGAKKCPAKGQESNTLVARAVSEVLKKKKHAKSTTKHEPI